MRLINHILECAKIKPQLLKRTGHHTWGYYDSIIDEEYFYSLDYGSLSGLIIRRNVSIPVTVGADLELQTDVRISLIKNNLKI